MLVTEIQIFVLINKSSWFELTVTSSEHCQNNWCFMSRLIVNWNTIIQKSIYLCRKSLKIRSDLFAVPFPTFPFNSVRYSGAQVNVTTWGTIGNGNYSACCGIFLFFQWSYWSKMGGGLQNVKLSVWTL